MDALLGDRNMLRSQSAMTGSNNQWQFNETVVRLVDKIEVTLNSIEFRLQKLEAALGDEALRQAWEENQSHVSPEEFRKKS